MNDLSGTRPAPVDDSVDLAVLAARIADDKQATDIVILDVGEVLSITGYFVVATASNPRLVRTVAESIEQASKTELGRSVVRTEGLREQRWILLDYGDVVVHVFHEDEREFYDIERLYRDVAKVEWAVPEVSDGTG
jgi:ribosome-associated protein